MPFDALFVLPALDGITERSSLIILKEITLRTTALCYEYLAAFVRTYMNTYYPEWHGEGCF